MKELHWLPLDAASWLVRTAALSPEAAAAYMNLRCHAWLAVKHGDAPCTVSADPEDLARLSGAGPRWKKIAAKVLAFFEQDGDRLRDADLFATWEEQQAAYQRRANAGSKGGKAKAGRVASAKQTPSNAVALLQQSESEGVSPAADAAGGDPPPPDGARAALTGSPAAGGTADVPDELTDDDRKQIALAGSVREFPLSEYQARLEERVRLWAELNADRWAVLLREGEARAREAMGEGASDAVVQRTALADARDAVRRKCGWPTYERYVVEQRAEQDRTRRTAQTAARLDLMRGGRARPEDTTAGGAEAVA